MKNAQLFIPTWKKVPRAEAFAMSTALSASVSSGNSEGKRRHRAPENATWPLQEKNGWKWFEIINLGWWLEICFFGSNVTPKIGERSHFHENILKEMGLIHPTSEASVYYGKWYILLPSVRGSTSRDVCFCWCFLMFFVFPPKIIEYPI